MHLSITEHVTRNYCLYKRNNNELKTTTTTLTDKWSISFQYVAYSQTILFTQTLALSSGYRSKINESLMQKTIYKKKKQRKMIIILKHEKRIKISFERRKDCFFF